MSEGVWRELGDKALGIEPPKPEPTPLERVNADWDEEERNINEHP